jgi:hypothetical protein
MQYGKTSILKHRLYCPGATDIHLRNRGPGFESGQGIYNVFRENISMLLCVIDFICIVC